MIDSMGLSKAVILSVGEGLPLIMGKDWITYCCKALISGFFSSLYDVLIA